MKKSGIYFIKSSINGKIYIGETNNLNRRKIRHFTDLNSGNHTNKYLQRHVGKYGIEDLEFSIIEELVFDKKILNEREKHWIKFYKSNNREFGFNLNEGGTGGYAHTMVYKDFHLVNIKTEKIEKYETISDFEEKNNLYKRHKIRDVLSGKRKVSLDFTTIENFNKIKAKSKKELKGRKPPPIRSRSFEILNLITNEVVFSENVSNFCRENNLNYICLLRVINGKRKKYKNWGMVKMYN